MTEILLTGFTPFDGRDNNASWVAASSLQASLPVGVVATLEIPVVWGMPSAVLQEAIQQHDPQVIISMGEGKPGCFQLETLAMNHRSPRRDNDGNLPPSTRILPGASDSLSSSAPLLKIRNALLQRRIPALLSLGAGGFLCEEALFVLEAMKNERPQLGQVMFIHVPPFATQLHFKGELRSCNEELLLEFVTDLYAICRDLYRQ